ncbi:sec-independent translocase [Streptomyces sp. 4N509B]|uniref:sec-independent translocase n=1 Tax=Streptomyces sp. 4N509B TaxID=3457413 RepID=UPI003FD5B965
MFFDIGSLEFMFLIVLAILVFGPEKLPKMIQDAARFVRKIREFSDSAKNDIRNELGPEFKDFELEDLNPRTFAKKHLLDNDDLGLKELGQSLDMRKELTEVADSVNGRPTRTNGKSGAGLGKGLSKGRGAGAAATSASAGSSSTATASTAASGTASEGSATAEPVRLAKDGDQAPAATPRQDLPPFDADAT